MKIVCMVASTKSDDPFHLSPANSAKKADFAGATKF
jgi:hypothetical protein